MLHHILLITILLSITKSNSSIQDLLKSQGLPAGLFPNNVKFYDLDQFGRLKVHLERPCVTKYEDRVYFDKIITANLSYGGLIGLDGMVQEKLFLWLDVKHIIVDDPNSGLILFDIGVARKQLSFAVRRSSCLSSSRCFRKERHEDYQGISRSIRDMIILVMSIQS